MLFSNAKLCITYFIVSFIGIYFLMGQILEYFIYRKIKLIYKLISQTKASKREEAYQKYVLPKKGIDDVRDDVEEWAAQKTKEIQDLQSNEAFRKEFLQNLSHEIKTPIFAIQGYLELLGDGAMDEPVTGKKFVQQAQSNVQRLVQLLSDVDAITNLEINKDPILKQSFIIQDIIDTEIWLSDIYRYDDNIETMPLMTINEINDSFSVKEIYPHILVYNNLFKDLDRIFSIIKNFQEDEDHSVFFNWEGWGYNDPKLNRPSFGSYIHINNKKGSKLIMIIIV
jgi:signal transduction histidine kinase